MKRKRDYRWASIEKVKLRRHPNEKKAKFSLKLETNQYFFFGPREREGERRRKERQPKRIRSQAKQETRIINDFCELIWHWEAARGGGGAALTTLAIVWHYLFARCACCCCLLLLLLLCVLLLVCVAEHKKVKRHKNLQPHLTRTRSRTCG